MPLFNAASPTDLDPQQLDSQQKALLVHERLCQVYGCPIPYFRALDPLSELVSALLSHRTTNRNSGKAFRQLQERFTSWEDLRDGDITVIREAIAPCTFPQVKAPRLKSVLQQITDRRGELSLDFLADLSVEEARHWLEEIPGVGPKTSAAVLCFSALRRPALPVDSHHHRVALRVGLIPSKTAVGPSHKLLAAQLPTDWEAQQVYDNHEVLMLHGQKCCHYRNPRCGECPLLDLCPTGQKLMSQSDG
ncbi:MAG: Fe-S cluster assembly protein HesB [Cyanobacteria bacterium J06638_20]